jgi:uncharacterized membrane protein
VRTRRHPNERQLVLLGFAAATAVCVALELFREHHYGATGFRFLLWNLVLAWIPLLLALVVYDCYRRGTQLWRLSPAIALWLLFLPNAPYLVTDFVHLSPGTTLYIDGVIVSAFAWTGAMLGFVSLYLMHAVIRHRFGARTGWLTALATLALASIGVYIGRYMQWNSWDLVTRPGARATELLQSFDQRAIVAHAAGVTMLLAVLLVLTYVAFYSLVLSLQRTSVSGNTASPSKRSSR